MADDKSGSRRAPAGRPRGGTRSPPTTSPSGSASTPPRASPRRRPPSCCRRTGPTRFPPRRPMPGWRRFLGQYAQLHADPPAHRRRRVARHRPVEHGRRADPADGVQRRGRPSPGGQGRERDERPEIDDEADRARPPRRCRVGDPGRGGRRRRRRADHRRRQRGRRRPDHPGELARASTSPRSRGRARRRRRGRTRSPTRRWEPATRRTWRS